MSIFIQIAPKSVQLQVSTPQFVHATKKNVMKLNTKKIFICFIFENDKFDNTFILSVFLPQILNLIH
jgi:hypothetical protein